MRVQGLDTFIQSRESNVQIIQLGEDDLCVLVAVKKRGFVSDTSDDHGVSSANALVN